MHKFPLALPTNEPIFSYEPGSPERASLVQSLEAMAKEKIEIPAIIGGKPVRGDGARVSVCMPHAHREILGEFNYCSEAQIEMAIQESLRAKAEWENRPWEDRAAVLLKAADLLAGKYRNILNAATMLGQSKNAYQAEIDSACELIDFLRFNAYFYQELQKDQPLSTSVASNRMEYRPLEGFVAAITPFNFSAIAGNLPTTPAVIGNVVVWKPSDTQMLAAHHTMKLFMEAGLPPGVINLVPADGPTFGRVILKHRDLAGIHFTGSSATFNYLWRGVGENLSNYRSYPRVVGETGGKDFVFAHPTAQSDALAVALTRGAFEYQGQKCSAASRAYIPRSLWKSVRDRMTADIATIKMGDVRDFKNFVNAVIDDRSFQKITNILKEAKLTSGVEIVSGGNTHGETGYFVEPTVLLTSDPKSRTMKEEIFGPVLTIFVYDDSKFDETLTLCDETSPYALTGAIFSQDPAIVEKMTRRLKYSAGNFYINDKPTGAVVAQQPFGGARASGTNDKAGSRLNLFRWISPRVIKTTFAPPTDYRYPFMG